MKTMCEKKCGTCKWYQPLESQGGRKGCCNYELPDFPISFGYVEVRRYLVENHFENCPTWEAKSKPSKDGFVFVGSPYV